MHRSNNSSPYPMFERLFAVILSVTDFQEITCVCQQSRLRTAAEYKIID